MREGSDRAGILYEYLLAITAWLSLPQFSLITNPDHSDQTASPIKQATSAIYQMLPMRSPHASYMLSTGHHSMLSLPSVCHHKSRSNQMCIFMRARLPPKPMSQRSRLCASRVGPPGSYLGAQSHKPIFAREWLPSAVVEALSGLCRAVCASLRRPTRAYVGGDPGRNRLPSPLNPNP